MTPPTPAPRVESGAEAMTPPTPAPRVETLADLLRRRAALIAVAVLFGAGGCATQPGGPSAPVSAAPAPSAAATVKAVSNKDAAVRDAATHLAAFRPPPGAQRLSGPPVGAGDLTSSVGGTAGNMADDTSWWKVPGGDAQAVLTAVPTPSGAQAGDTWNSGPSGPSYGAEWDWPEIVGHLVNRHIEVNTRRVGTAVILRVDAIAIWIPPRPATTLVPADVPVLVVTYNPPGIGPTQSTPLGPVTITDRTEIAAVVAEVNAAPVEPYGARPCPASVGRMTLSFRSSAGTEQAQAQVDIGGCDDIYVTVGSASATLSGGSTLVGQILGTLHLPWKRP